MSQLRIGTILLLVIVATVSAFPTNYLESENSHQQGRNDLGNQEPVKIVPVVILSEDVQGKDKSQFLNLKHVSRNVVSLAPLICYYYRTTRQPSSP